MDSNFIKLSLRMIDQLLINPFSLTFLREGRESFVRLKRFLESLLGENKEHAVKIMEDFLPYIDELIDYLNMSSGIIGDDFLSMADSLNHHLSEVHKIYKKSGSIRAASIFKD